MTVQDLKPARIARGRGSAADAVGPAHDLKARARRMAEVAAAHAEAVDRDGRFPAEAFATAREERLLGVMVPQAFGGEGVSLSDIVDVCYTLGRACASTAAIYAMHQVKVACIVRHGTGAAWHEAFLRDLAAQQLLVASSTTEGKGGGNIRSSEAPVERTRSRFTLNRDASVISYGAEADAIVTTARRASDAAASDQVLLVLRRADYTLEKTLEWDTFGMRGTCSAGFALSANGQVAQILPEPYDVIHAQTMVPASHLTWSGAWAGIAAGAVERAQRYTRKAMRGSGGELPPGAPHFTKAVEQLRTLRALIGAALNRYEAVAGQAAALSAMDFQTAINLLKVDSSELAVATVMSAMRACGLSGYRNDTDVSIGRMLRDVLSAPIMISNERILTSMAAAVVVSDVPARVRD